MEDINNKNKNCIVCNETYATFCKKGETKATHCETCAKIVSIEENIEMVNINSPKCVLCNKTQASFCKKGETKATHCKDCSLETGEEMIDINHKNNKCVLCKKTRASFCIEGRIKATHCSSCSKLVEDEENIEMICLYAKKCKNMID